MKKLLKDKKAITLIALVITIIILLILAGITISQLTGSGLFDNSKLAKEKYKNSEEYEEFELGKYNNEINKYIGNNRDFDIKSIKLDYDNKVDIKSYNASTNKYIVPSAGIIITSAVGKNDQSGGSFISISGIEVSLCGDGQLSVAWGFNSYSQIVTEGTEIYFYIIGDTTLNTAYFVPFK